MNKPKLVMHSLQLSEAENVWFSLEKYSGDEYRINVVDERIAIPIAATPKNIRLIKSWLMSVESKIEANPTNDEFLQAAQLGIPLSDYRAEKLELLEAESERLKAAIGSLLKHEYWCEYFEGNHEDYHRCVFCGGKVFYSEDAPPIDQYPHRDGCVALAAHKLIQEASE